MRPPFAYYGGKSGMARTIVELLPPHSAYIEPFAGSLAVLFAKAPSVHEIVNDVDEAVVTFFRVLREQPDELARVCALTPHARAEFAAADLGGGNLDDLERARRFWVRVNQSFGKTAGSRTGWSITTARTQSVPMSVLGRVGRFAACADRLARVSIECCDAADLVERLATSDTVVYADPPYLAKTRRSGEANPYPTDYRHDMGDAASHERLAEVLRATPATVILSGYPSELYEDLYGDWWQQDFTVNVHSSNASKAQRKTRVERLWSNRALDTDRLFAVAQRVEIPS